MVAHKSELELYVSIVHKLFAKTLNNFSVWVKFSQGCSWDWDNYFKVNFIVCLVGNLATGARFQVVISRGANFFSCNSPFLFFGCLASFNLQQLK